jgi:precorrin-2 dehydrogenase/sirohydrochlorin ferrochelatase
MDAFPAFFPLAGRTVVIAGAGEAAEAKARLFDGSPARIVRLEGATALDPEAYAGAALAFVASPDDAFAQGAAA